ncbi:MAG: UbiD family decarboxylase [Deltaproteobacteria bacterium]|nr:UbiD family decarboxylase [Deltaproteobacteria bacterium]
MEAAAKALRQSATGKDLRGFIRYLEEHYPCDVLRVAREVDPIFEATAILSRLEKEDKFPLVIFEKVKKSTIPVVANTHAAFHRNAMAIGLEPDAGPRQFAAEYARREAAPIEPAVVRTGPCKEVVLKGSEVDLTALPTLKYHEKDAGRYITHAFTVMKDPETGIRNAGIYRYQVFDKTTAGIQLSETAHGHYIFKKNLKRGRPTEIAAVIGHHPAVSLGCLSFTSIDVDEFSIAGAMLGEPIELVRCDGVDLEVPANCEIVLEGYIDPKERRPEAPFGEYPGTYGPQRNNPVVHFNRITMRENPLYQSSFVGHPDNLLMSGLTRLSAILSTVRLACPSVKEVYVPPSGRCRYVCYVAMEKLIEGDPKNAAMAAFAADPFLKFVVVVDDDVDILKDAEVIHAIAQRVRWYTDTFQVTHARGSPLDPASYDPAGGSHIVTKVGIDATRKANFPEEIRVPGTDKVDLDALFGVRWREWGR